MSQENVETVRRNIEAWNRGDVTTWLALFRSDGEIDWSRARGPFKGVYRGHDEFRAFSDEFWSTFEDVQLETYGFAEAGRDVVVSNTAHVRGRQGIEVIARSTFVYTVEEGKIARLRLFQERAEALEAVGLSQENVDVVRRSIEAWNRHDLTMWLATFSPDAEIDWSRAQGPSKGVYRGRDKQEAFWDVFRSRFDDVQLEPFDFADAGSEVVISNTAHIRGRDGTEETSAAAFVYTVENEQIARLRMFQERAEALKAAGLSE